MRKCLVLLVFTALLSFGHSQAQGRVGAFALSRGDLIEDILFKYYDENDFNGSVLVAEADQIIYENTFGLANFDSGEPLDANIPFYIASLSKQFTAAAVMKLVEMGKIDLDHPITRYLPLMPDFYGEVKVYHLLTHTGGIPDYLNDDNLVAEGFTNEDVYSYLINRQSLSFKPGSRFRYSNSGYVLLAMIIQVASGQTIENYLTNHIFNPFGLEHSFVYSEISMNRNRVSGFSERHRLDDYNLLTVGDGGIYSTTRDLYHWQQVLNSGKFISQESLDKIYESVILTNGRTRRYGFGWEIGSNSQGPLVYHSGELVGFRNYMEWQINSESSIIILTNNSFPEIAQLRNALVKVLDGRLKSLPDED